MKFLHDVAGSPEPTTTNPKNLTKIGSVRSGMIGQI